MRRHARNDARARDFDSGTTHPLRIIDDGYAEMGYSQASWQASRRVLTGEMRLFTPLTACDRRNAGG